MIKRGALQQKWIQWYTIELSASLLISYTIVLLTFLLLSSPKLLHKPRTHIHEIQHTWENIKTCRNLAFLILLKEKVKKIDNQHNSIQNFFANIRSKRYSIPNIYDQYERTNDNTNGIPFFKFFSFHDAFSFLISKTLQR